MVKEKCSSEKWYKEVEKYKKVRNELNKHIAGYELNKNKWGLRTANWYRFNAPNETNIKTYMDFVVWCGFESNYNHFTKDEVKKIIMDKYKELKRPLKTSDFSSGNKTKVYISTIESIWGSFNNMKKELGFEETGTFRGHVYSKEELIKIIQDFVEKYGFVPDSKFVEEHALECNLPNRKTFTNKFGSFQNVILEAGFKSSGKSIVKKVGNEIILIYDDKNFIKQTVLDYIEKYSKIPTMRELFKEHNHEFKSLIQKHFGTWNNCLTEMGLKLNSVSQYNDNELEKAFRDFIESYNRVPSIKDFNKTGRPSFWVYQQRFGSWAEACIAYGYKPNCRDEKYYMDDGEVCDSSYEYDISVWLKSHNITYERNINYQDFIDDYKGKMNCDYKFTLPNGQIWYVEMAGFITTYDFNKLKQKPEQIYYFKIKYKKKLLKRQKLNYIIISVDDFKNKSLSEIFYFLNIKESEVLNA